MLLPSQRELPKIPSEFIEKYLQQWLMVQLEYFYMKVYPYEEIMANLKAVESFNSHFGGLHSTIATTNVYYPMYQLDEEKLREFCIKLFKDKENT